MPLAETTSSLHNPFGFTGYQGDEISGLYYAEARYYDPHTSRMTATDSWGGTPIVPQTLNKYTYCINNPVALVDRNGAFPELAEIIDYVDDFAGEAFNVAYQGIMTGVDFIEPASEYIDLAIKTGIVIGNIPYWQASAVLRATGIDRDAYYSLADIGGPLLMMERSDQGTYHARQDCWQQYFGYNDIYDKVFDIGTSMDRAKFIFEYNGEEYNVWGWKGDYTNLGAGAELGIYRRLTLGNVETDHWLVDTDLAMPMTLRLKDISGNKIFAYYPEDPQWWITGFNPQELFMPADQMVAIFTMDFSGDPGMFYAFMNSKDGEDPRLVFNPFTYTVTFTFVPKGMEGACVV